MNDYAYRIVEVWEIFDVLHFSKDKAFEIEDENGTHKDVVKHGYVVIETDEYDDYMKQGYTVDHYRHDSIRDARMSLHDEY